MTRRIIAGFLMAYALMAGHALVSLGADAVHFEALHLTRLEQALALPDMRVSNLDGQEVALRSFREKVILINFWTTWCSWFGVSGTPSNFMVDRSGNIVGGGSGYRDWTAPAAHQLIESLLTLAQGGAPATETARAALSWRTADPANTEQVKAGQALYAKHCAVCHGVNLEGQPNWKETLPTGGLPAPPHDETGHTWHHADALLFKIVKFGGQIAGDPSFKSNMPAFQSVLSNAEIWAVLAFIKSHWPPKIRTFQNRANAQEQ